MFKPMLGRSLSAERAMVEGLTMAKAGLSADPAADRATGGAVGAVSTCRRVSRADRGRCGADDGR